MPNEKACDAKFAACAHAMKHAMRSQEGGRLHTGTKHSPAALALLELLQEDPLGGAGAVLHEDLFSLHGVVVEHALRVASTLRFPLQALPEVFPICRFTHTARGASEA